MHNPIGVLQRPNNSGITPLQYAVKYRHSDIAQVLLEAGAKLTSDELQQAILDGKKSKEVVRVLIDAKPDGLNSVDARGRAPLHCAVQKHSWEVVFSLLEAGNQFNENNFDLSRCSCLGSYNM